MSLQLYNTLSRKKEEFKPLNAPKVGMYVCGVTVYDYCHLGHARALINFDVLYRYLQFKKYDVNFVRNYTDVDDKIINRANEQKVPWNEVSEKFIAAFNEDMDALGNRKPTMEPKATENIAEMIKVIEGLMAKGIAYRAGNDIFYSVRKKADYGKLSGKKIDELESGARIEVHEEKNDPLDFCLWKSSKPGEPTWDSPWGPGRPGWHIECSAMSMRFLGETFDIHGGGRDLSFPHHENEIAQSEGYSGKDFARYWVHNGFVNINAEKMSKSLGNFLTIRQMLEKYPAEVLRAFVLAAHYRSPLDYTDQNLQSSRQSLERWYSTLKRAFDSVTPSPLMGEGQGEGVEQVLKQKISSIAEDFESSMDDDLNTAKVFAIIFDLARDLNKQLDEHQSLSSELVLALQKQVQSIHHVLGVFGQDPDVFLNQLKEMSLSQSAMTAERIEELLTIRREARKSKNFAEADRVRKELADAGVEIKDNPDGTTVWSMK